MARKLGWQTIGAFELWVPPADAVIRPGHESYAVGIKSSNGGDVVHCTLEEWAQFVAAIKSGEFG